MKLSAFLMSAAVWPSVLPRVANAQTNAAQATASQAVKSGRVMVNGVNYYYEVHGKGEPLLLLHGGLGSIDMFSAHPAQARRSSNGYCRRPARPWPYLRSRGRRSN
jgi:hypothetical protein